MKIIINLQKIFRQCWSLGLILLALLLRGWFFQERNVFSASLFEMELGKIEGLCLSFIVILDIYSVRFISRVFLISSCVLRFSSSYMTPEKYFVRFHLLVLRFIGAMCLLILSPNLIRVLLGWDGLGITSYLLVVYFQRRKSYNAGILTALTNRVGDVVILTRIAILAFLGNWSFTMFSHGRVSPLISLMLISLAACTKSAQIPFSAWLPAAIAAPTPVSALVHSSTLVTAGVYLLFRFQPALSLMGLSWGVITVGSATIFMAGCAALFETDIKKIVALSTLSQLGVIITTLGMGISVVAFLHLLAHAFFKALLFISVGRIIHLSRDYQDLRKVGGSFYSCPVTLRFSLLANLSLCGLPFCRGFYSKDLCIELFFTHSSSVPLSLIFFLATALTCAYTFRFLFLVCLSFSRNPSLIWVNDKDESIIWAMAGLAPLALVGGGILCWALFPSPSVIPLTLLEKNVTLTIVLGGALLGAALVILSGQQRSPKISSLGGVMWALPLISSRFWNKYTFKAAHSLRLISDLNWTPLITLSGLSTTGAKSRYVTQNALKPFLLISILLPILLLLTLYLRVPSSWLSWSQIPNLHIKKERELILRLTKKIEQYLF